DKSSTAIDWNRNGVFGEKGVRADINDGYSATYRSQVKLEFAAGATALAALGSTLVVVYPDLPKREDYKEFEHRALSKERIGKLQVQLIENGKPGPPQTIVESEVAGDPTAATFGNTVWVSYPTVTGYSFKSLRKVGSLLKETTTVNHLDADSQPTLVALPDSLAVLVWSEKTQAVSLKVLTGEPQPDQLLEAVTSQYPVGATWNSKKKCLAVVTPVKQGDKPGRLKINHLRKSNGQWTVFETIWVEGDKGTAATSWRPQVIFDPSKDRGPEGAYMVFIKGGYADPHQGGLNYLCRQIADKTLGDGWRTKMLGNEWANTRSVCGVTNYKGDIAYAVRWHAGKGGNEDARLTVSLRASGIENEWLTDFDEVGYVFKTGLARSLQNVRDEQWRPKRKT
ncbi:MAG: hypothetical protein ABL962_10645, partial [Fimbriimonadaceae bacterium]